ncbi:MAG: ATP-dependent DNA helicase RecG, partial [Solirubrobacterales bacterium]|nr:ATP-dependent DNA helicase RecG [Solirubrobacterales bacterium]
GVVQRSALDRKGMRTAGGAGAPHGAGAASERTVARAPHVLHMTATPIPRTLALTRYGDLDVTRLHELPRGRGGVRTEIAGSERARGAAYERLRAQLRAGRQAFVVCPLVEESEQLEARAATAEYERLTAGELRDFRVVLIHGQMRAREKQAAMAAFVDGRAQVLVSTTVIEVGIDVPNATVMVVEDADRYGISQLHQLRGRVGRGPHGGECVLCGPRHSRRLQAVAQHRDGFALAEIDLRLRGEGEIGGHRQSGQAELSVARLPQDADLLERARGWAAEIVARDPELRAPEHALLAQLFERRLGEDARRPLPA